MRRALGAALATVLAGALLSLGTVPASAYREDTEKCDQASDTCNMHWTGDEPPTDGSVND